MYRTNTVFGDGLHSMMAREDTVHQYGPNNISSVRRDNVTGTELYEDNFEDCRVELVASGHNLVSIKARSRSILLYKVIYTLRTLFEYMLQFRHR